MQPSGAVTWSVWDVLWQAVWCALDDTTACTPVLAYTRLGVCLCVSCDARAW
jgi:hypothetical protein